MGCLRALQEMRLELRKTMKPPVEIERKKRQLYAQVQGIFGHDASTQQFGHPIQYPQLLTFKHHPGQEKIKLS